MKPITEADNVLIIKHGALGDFVLALPAMAAIRAHFPKARITLQTTPALASLASVCPYCDEFDPDGRPKGAFAELGVASRVRAGKYDIVYDLQNSERTAALHFLLPFGPQWNGIASGASHRVHDPDRLKKHVMERMAEQVALTGIAKESALALPDLSWAAASGAPPQSFGLNGRYLLIAASASARGKAKQWPAERFAAIARRVAKDGATPVLIGTEDERAALDDIVREAPGALNLAGKTTLPDIAALGAGAIGIVGNDTGPVFVAAAAGAPAAVLYSRHSLPPDVCAPRGPRGVIAVTGRELANITVDAAEQAMARLEMLKCD